MNIIFVKFLDKIFRKNDDVFDFSIKGKEYEKHHKINKNINEIFFNFFIDKYNDFRLNIGIKYNNTHYAYEIFILRNTLIRNKNIWLSFIPKQVYNITYILESNESVKINDDLNYIFDCNYLNKKINSLLIDNRQMLSPNYELAISDIQKLTNFSRKIEKELNKLINK